LDHSQFKYHNERPKSLRDKGDFVSPSFKLTTAVFTATLISACASVPNNDSTADNGNGLYFESSFNDHNRAPASLTPPPPSDKVTNIDPLYMRTQADYNYAVGESLSLDGHRQKAIEAFKMTLLYDPDSAAVRLRLAAEYLKAGMVNEAVEEAKLVVEKDPKNVEAHSLLGGLYSTMKIYPKAIEQYETVIKLDPENNEAPLYLGAVYSEQKQHDKAIRYFESLAKRSEYPNPHLIYYYIGRVRLDQSELKYQKAAEQAFKKSLELKPGFADSVIALSALYSREKKEKMSVSVLIDFQKNQGPNSRVAEILSQYYMENGKYDEAYEQLEYLESSDDALNVKLKMALILIEKKIYDKATVKLEEILREAPESDKIRFYLGAVYEETKHDQKAIAQYKKIPGSSRFYSDAVTHAAYLLKNSGKMDEGISLLEKAIADKKGQPQIYSMYASLLEEKGDLKEAQVHFYYGTLHDKAGDKDKVEGIMKTVLELNPNHVQGLNYLAYTWAEKGEHLEEAESLARKAMQLEPKDGYVMDTLGWILFKRGNLEESIKVLEGALKSQPAVGIIAEHLGDVYYKKTLTDRALRMYNKALNLETDPKKIEELRQKITSIDQQKVLERVPAHAHQVGDER
jgi:tetratricopeptide (TPR) repeat protein